MSQKSSPLSDEELIQGILKGGTSRNRMTEYLYDHHAGMIYTGIKRFKLSMEEVRDAYADTIIDITAQIAKGAFEGRSKISTYLYGIFSNKCKNQLRSLKAKAIQYAEEMPNLPDKARNRLQSLVQSEEMNRLLTLLDQVGEKCRQIVLDAEIHGYNYTEIAERIGFKNAASVHSMKYRCISKLKALIKKTASDPFLE